MNFGTISKYLLYNLFGFWPTAREFLAVILILSLVFFLIRKSNLPAGRKKQIGFLSLWLGSNFFLDFFGGFLYVLYKLLQIKILI